MKKAKFILTAIGLITIISSLLSFKAKNKHLGFFKCSTTVTRTCPCGYTTFGTWTTTLYCTLSNATVPCSILMGVHLNS